MAWGNKDKKIAQQSTKKKAEPTLLSEAAAAAKTAGGGYAGQLAKGNLKSAQSKAVNGKLGGEDVLSTLVQDQGVAKALWRVRTDTVAGPKILCLHGYTQNGSIFKKKLAGLEKYIKQHCPNAVFTFPTAPHEAQEEWVTLDEEDLAVGGAAVQSRSWWAKTPSAADGAEMTMGVKMTEGVKMKVGPSSYGGWDKSLELLEGVRMTKGPFDVVLGFSQGAAAAALLAVAWKVPACVTAGGYVARGHPLAAALELGEHPVRTLHAAGANDTLVTETASQELASLFQRPVFFAHDGGHAIPGTDEFRSAFVELLMEEPPSAARAAAAPGTPREGGGSEAARPMTPREPAAQAAAARKARAVQLSQPSVPMLVEVEEDSEVADELEALEAIFMEEYVPEPQLPHVGFSVRLNCEELEEVLTAPLYLSFEIPAEYPAVAPLTQLRSRPLSEGDAGASLRMVLKPSVAKAVMAAYAASAKENKGDAQVYEMVSAARECITESHEAGLGEDEADAEPEVEGGASGGGDFAEGAEEEEDPGPISRALALQLQTEATVLGGEEETTGSLPRR